jgi:predicted O-linked N-acetylglucosamine transferase (SPINDLY family)
LRVGYFSGDFREHPVATLMAGVFEQHDRARFETYAFSFGPDTGDAMRARLTRAFHRFIDVRAETDAAITAMARNLEIDIAVDLAGYTAEARAGIFAQRTAPVQISYLGYPGTLGSPHIDYIIADNVVVPPEARVHFSEKVIALPCFQPNDPARAIAPGKADRPGAGLPEDAFVFCCFNNIYKITPATFASWMRILKAIDKGVLWFLGASAAAQRNLKEAAARAGIAPERLFFAPRVASNADHLARHRCADLFLDTLPFNAHTTASDALWAGLPVLTCPGESYASRVAASLLYALGLAELVTPHREAYEQTAVSLAQDPARLAALRDKLTHARAASTLFDVKSITAALENAFVEADARHRQGLAPADIVISS